MNILVVEDEIKTATYLSKGLGENGYAVDHADNGWDGLNLAHSGKYDLIVLDVVLPRCDGWTILDSVRSTSLIIPILLLTARDSVQDRVKGLDMGADDYLVKPFAFSELLARIRSLLRRGYVPQEEVLHIADLEIDLNRLKVKRAGKAIKLSQTEFSLLTLLAQHTGQIQTRTLIAEKVWNMNFDSATNLVDVAIRRLRSKVDDSFENKLIHTVRGVGYVLEEEL
jgi:two-component system copper resistance phosphate regulon response regulator CusR